VRRDGGHLLSHAHRLSQPIHNKCLTALPLRQLLTPGRQNIALMAGLKSHTLVVFVASCRRTSPFCHRSVGIGRLRRTPEKGAPPRGDGLGIGDKPVPLPQRPHRATDLRHEAHRVAFVIKNRVCTYEDLSHRPPHPQKRKPATHIDPCEVNRCGRLFQSTTTHSLPHIVLFFTCISQAAISEANYIS